MGEKRLGKKFQYDMPSDLVMTYISEVRKFNMSDNDN